MAVTRPPPSPSPATGGGGGAAGGGTPGGGPPDANPELLSRGTGPNPEFIMRDFTSGMHCNPTRDAIAEQDLWWLENLQPLASGNVVPVTMPLLITNSLAGETQLPAYTTNVMVGQEGYVFAYFNNTGNGWIVNSNTGAATKIISGELPITTSPGQVSAIPYMGGFLVVSLNGHYWDYNLTTANALYDNSGGIASWTNTHKTSFPGGTVVRQVLTGSGTGGNYQVHYQVISVQLQWLTGATQPQHGSKYQVGDSLTLTDGFPFRPAQIIVTQVGSNGEIQNVNLADGGDYPGPTTHTPTWDTGPTGAVISGGSSPPGDHAVFTTMMQATSVTILNPGHGFSAAGATLADVDNATSANYDNWTGAVGVTSGNAIATYAGRVWIGDGYQIFVTDINSYNSFGGAGTSFTISDSYFTGCTALFSANNYLYIFSAQSVDVVSNVVVAAPGSLTAGTTSFTRINVLQGIGCAFPQVSTICGFARGIAFLDITGYYLLSGATPERVSDRWQAVVRTINFADVSSAGVFNLNNELCLGVTVKFVDSFAAEGTPVTRTCTFMLQRHRWWVHSTPYQLNCGPVAAVPTGVTLPGLYLWVDQGGSIGLARLFGTQAQGRRRTLIGVSPWLLRTKLWDGAAAFREKQSINLSFAAIWTDPWASPGVSFTVDSELYNSPPVDLPDITHAGGYNYALQVYRGAGASQAWGSQFIGLTFKGDGSNVNVVEGVAMRGKQERNMLE